MARSKLQTKCNGFVYVCEWESETRLFDFDSDTFIEAKDYISKGCGLRVRERMKWRDIYTVVEEERVERWEYRVRKKKEKKERDRK